MFDIETQRLALSKLPDKRFIQTSAQVKGPYTSGGYVIWMLNSVFGPDNWRHTLVHGPEIVRLSESQAYVQVTVRLDAQFANGNQVAHEDVGVWPLAATNAKQGGTLDETAPERYETVLKACVTDGLKACAEYLGVCFRPLADQALAGAITAAAAVSGSNGAGAHGVASTARTPVERKPAAAPAPAERAPTPDVKATDPALAPTPQAAPVAIGSDFDASNHPAAAPNAAAVEKAIADAQAARSHTNAATAKPAAPAPATHTGPHTGATGLRKQSSLRCTVKEFDRLCADLSKRYQNYRRPDGTPDKAHMLYTLYACGFPVLTDTNLEPAFEAAARHAAGLPDAPAAASDDNELPF